MIYPQSKGTGRAVFGVGICCCVTFFWVIVMIVGFLMIQSVHEEHLTATTESLTPKFIPACGAEQQCRGVPDVLTD